MPRGAVNVSLRSLALARGRLTALRLDARGRGGRCLRGPAIERQRDGRHDHQRRVRSGDDADHQDPGEAADHVAAEGDQCDENEEHGAAGEDRSRQRLVDGEVEVLGQRQALLDLAPVLAHAVVHDDRVVDRVADDREQGRDDVQRELELHDQHERQRDRDVVHDAGDRAHAEREVAEAEPDVEAHRQRGEDDREKRFALQLGADLRSDVFLAERIEASEVRLLVEKARGVRRHALGARHLLHAGEDADLRALIDDLLREIVVVLDRLRVRAAIVGIILLEQRRQLVTAVVVEIVLTGLAGIEPLVQLPDDLAGVIALSLLFRKADVDVALFRLAILLDRRIGKIAAQLGERNRVSELERDRCAAGEVDAPVDAVGEVGGDGRDDEDHRDGDALPAVLDELVIGIDVNLHGGLLARLDAELLRAIGRLVDDVENHSRYEKRGEHRRAETDQQRDGESFDRAGAELKQEQRRDDRGEVRIDDRGERAGEALLDRRAHGFLLAQLFADALEYQYVRVDGHPQREDDAGEAGQRERGVEVRHHAEQDDEVQEERDDSVDAGALVVHDQRRDKDQESDHRRGHALANGVASERRTDRTLFELRERRRKRSAAQHEREVVGLLRREAAFDDALAGDLTLDDRIRDDFVVEDDRHVAADVVFRQRGELRRSVRREREPDDRLADAALLHARVLEIASADRHILLDRDILDADNASHVIFLVRGENVGRRALCGRERVEHRLRRRRAVAFDEAELQLRGRLDDVLHARRVVDARELDDDTVVRFRNDDRLRDAQRVDAAIDRLDGLRHRVALELRLRLRLHVEAEAVADRRDLERREEVSGNALVVRRRNARGRIGDERQVVDAANGRHRQVLRLCLRAQRVHALIGLEAHGLVDVHAHHQMHAAFEVESALDRLGIARRRNDGDGEDRQHAEDQHDFPNDIAIQRIPPERNRRTTTPFLP